MNLSPNVRQAIYAITAITSPLVAYLGTEGRLDAFYVGLYSVIVTAVTALAFSKVNPEE